MIHGTRSCWDARIYESVSEFNQKTLSFLSRQID